MDRNVGILSIGLYLPEHIRKNDYWPDDVVDVWRQRLSTLVPRAASYVKAMTPGVELTLAAMAKYANDPFQGARERRVAADDETSSDMEARAAAEALNGAGVKPDGIDLLLNQSMIPDYLCMNSATVVHHKVGLAPSTKAFTIDAVCASFAPQLLMAQSLMRAGEASQALLTQSSAAARIMAMDQPFSAWVGDAATAAVVGPVDPGLGLLSSAFRSNGALHGGFVATVPNKRWYDEGRVVGWNADREAARQMQLTTADTAREVLFEALEKAQLGPSDVDFFVSHQPSAWLREVVQTLCGFDKARSVDAFPWAGSVSSATPLLQLAVAQREGLLKRGDTVAIFAAASGLMASATILRWAL